jgi:hypothetical protein
MLTILAYCWLGGVALFLLFLVVAGITNPPKSVKDEVDHGFFGDIHKR